MQIGIIGLLNAGKSTLFDILTNHISAPHDRPAGEARHGIMTLYDSRLDTVARIHKSKKITHPTVTVVDLPPMRILKSASETEASNIIDEVKNSAALIQVVRRFSEPAVPIPESGINALKDKAALDSEMGLLDLTIVENRLDRIAKTRQKKPDSFHLREPEILLKCKEILESEEPLSTLQLDHEDEKLLRGYQFLTLKPRITVVNIDENEIPGSRAVVREFEEAFPAQKGMFIAACCRAEQELLEFSDENERNEFSREFGIEQPSASIMSERIISSMNLIRFLTGSSQEARSWLIPQGSTAQEAAGTIHSDIERGFIRAEVVVYDDLTEYGSEARCKEHGKYRLEGKKYIVQDGDVIYFRFNV